MVQLHETTGHDWEEMAKIYKQLTVGVSSRPITLMLERANALWPFSEASGVHDNGCGPGPIITRIINDYGSALPKSCALSASDFAPAMVQQVQAEKEAQVQLDPRSPWGRLEVSVMDAMDLDTIGDDTQSHVTAGWVFFMTPDPFKCLSESRRVLRSGGVLVCSSWQDSEWMQLTQLATKVRFDAQLPSIPEEWKTKVALSKELERAGFCDVETHEVEVEMSFECHDALVELLTTKMPHMMQVTRTWTVEEKHQLRELMLQQLRDVSPREPGTMHGIALVALGRK